MERYDIAAWRSRYLRTLKLNRDSENRRPVIYLDETYIHSSYGVNKCWQSEEVAGSIKEISLGQRWIIVHAGSAEGFVQNALLIFKSHTKSGDYHDEMNATNFKKWLVEKLIPNLPSQSIVVMDNAPYHCVKLNKPPTISSQKKVMQEWIKNNGLSYLDTMTKPELYEIIKINKKPDVFEADDILKQHGHQVVRLPPYHCDLNPIELIWASVKRKVAETNVGRSKTEMLDLVQNAFQAVTAETWKTNCEHIERLEEEYRNDDVEIENFNICLDSDSDTSSDSTSSELEDVEDHLVDHSYSKNK